MLQQRIITAAVLVVILLGALLASSIWPLVVVLSAAAACTLWEWLRLVLPENQARRWPLWAAGVFFVLALFMAWQTVVAKPALWALGLRYFTLYGLVWLLAAFWVLAVPAVLVRGQVRKPEAPIANGLFAVLACWAAWFALVQLYISYGAWFLLSLLAFVWAADIAAYFVGKRYGKRKLAATISPGKTLEGAVGGVLGATLWLLLSSLISGSFGALMLATWSWPLVVLLSIGLACLSIAGDLFESLLKRRAGQKDSSRLLPGHGGVYDRLDALLPVATLAFVLLGADGL